MNVRDATSDDARRIAGIHVASWQAAYRGIMPDGLLDGLSVDERERRWRELIEEDERMRMRVVLDEEKIIGWASFGDCRDEDLPAGTAEVYGLYLDPACWRRGGGRTLWEHIVGELRGEGVREMAVRVLEANANARQFYEAMGCVLDQAGTTAISRGGTELTEIRYRCEVTPST